MDAPGSSTAGASPASPATALERARALLAQAKSQRQSQRTHSRTGQASPRRVAVSPRRTAASPRRSAASPRRTPFTGSVTSDHKQLNGASSRSQSRTGSAATGSARRTTAGSGSSSRTSSALAAYKPLISPDDVDEELAEAMSQALTVLQQAQRKLLAAVRSDDSAAALASLGDVLAELAVIPTQPAAKAEALFDDAGQRFEAAVAKDPNSIGITAKYGNYFLRRGVFYREVGSCFRAGQTFAEAARWYGRLFELAPKQGVVRLTAFAQTHAPSLDPCSFLGTFDNLYGLDFVRAREEAGLQTTLQYHWDKVLSWPVEPASSTTSPRSSARASSGTAPTSLHPLFRYHCFEALKRLVTSLELAVADNSIPDQASLLLWMWGNFTKLALFEHATSIALFLLKLYRDFQIDALRNAAPQLEDHILRHFMQTISPTGEERPAVMSKEQAASRLEVELEGLGAWDSEIVFEEVAHIHQVVSDEEFARVCADSAPLTMEQVELSELLSAASSTYKLSQLLAARAYEALLAVDRPTSVARVVRTLCREEKSIKLLAHLCLNDSYELVLSACRALLAFLQHLKTPRLAVENGVLEAVVYTLHNDNSQVQYNAAACVDALRKDPVTTKALMRYEQVACERMLHLALTTGSRLAHVCLTNLRLLYKLKDEVAIDAMLRVLRPNASVTEREVTTSQLSRKLVKAARNSFVVRSVPQKAEALVAEAKTITTSAPPVQVTSPMKRKERIQALKSATEMLVRALDMDEANTEGRKLLVSSCVEVGTTLLEEAKATSSSTQDAFAMAAVIGEARGYFEQALDAAPHDKQLQRAVGQALNVEGATKVVKAKNMDVGQAQDDMFEEAYSNYRQVVQIAERPEATRLERRRQRQQVEDGESAPIADAEGAHLASTESSEDLVDDRGGVLDPESAAKGADDNIARSVEVPRLSDLQFEVPGIEVPVFGVADLDHFNAPLVMESPVMGALLNWGEALKEHIAYKDGEEAELLLGEQIDKYERFLALSPDDAYALLQLADAYANKAAAYVAQQRYGAADALYSDAINVYRRHIELYDDVGARKACAEALVCQADCRVASSDDARAADVLPLLDESDALLGKDELANSRSTTHRSTMIRSMLTPAPRHVATTMRTDMMTGDDFGFETLQEKQAQQELGLELAASKVQHRTGRMQKQGGGTSLFGRKSWRSRLFHLDETHLSYYAKTTAESPKGVIRLENVVEVETCELPRRPGFVFHVVTRTRTYFMQATDDEDRTAWMEAILNNVGRLRLLKQVTAS